MRCEEGTIQSVSISKKIYLDRNKCCQILFDRHVFFYTSLKMSKIALAIMCSYFKLGGEGSALSWRLSLEVKSSDA